MPSLTNLQDLRTVLGRLNAERPAVHGAEPGRTKYEPRGDDFLKRLDLDVRTRQGQSRARVLVTGQIGVGKSSDLWKFFYQTRMDLSTGFAVHCDLEKQEHPERCSATGVLLTILRDCWGSLKGLKSSQKSNSDYNYDELIEIRNRLLTQLIDWLKGKYTDQKNNVVFQFGGMDFKVSLGSGRKNAALALILGKAAQHEAVAQPSERFGIAPDSLVNSLNRLLRWIRITFGNRPPTLIVDHVDKIREPDAVEDVLLKAMTHWERLEASLVMTAPYEYTLGDLRNSVESKWGLPRVLYPLDIPERDGGPIPSIYEKIVRSAGLATMISSEGLRLTAHYSGGVLRTFVQFLIEAAKEAHFAGHDRIEQADALTVIHVAERAYQDYNRSDLKLLDEISRSGTGLREATRILRSPIGLIVVRGEGDQQELRVHPLAQRALEKFRRNMRQMD